MALPIPNLDDRSFNDLLQEAKSLIPIYNKDWTNHNPSDPGITLLEMFAWLSEMIIYRLNQVPEANYRAFLELLGISYAFRWDEVPGRDNNRLFKFLSENYGIIWLQPVTVSKAPEEQTISITDGKNNIAMSLNPERNKVIVDFHTGKSEVLEAKPEYLFYWNDIPGADDKKLLEFANDIFDVPLDATIKLEGDSTILVAHSGGRYVSFSLSQNQDYVNLTSYTGRKLRLAVIKEKDKLKVTWLRIYLPVDQDIQRGLASLKQRYRAITTADFEELTLECMRQLQPDLTGRVIGMMNRDLEHPGSNPDAEKPGHVSVILLVSGEKPVCSWDDIPGTDNVKLKDFLTRLYSINWLANSVISKSTDNQQITVETADHSSRILLNKISDDKVTLDCPGYLTDELLVRKENLDGKEKSYLYAYGTGDARPSILLKRRVKQFLSQRKLVTTRVHVVPPDYYPLKLEVQIVLNPNTNATNVKKMAETIVKRYFNPLEGGENNNGWPLGRYIYRSEIYQLLEGVPGVDHVASLILYENVPGQAQLRPLTAPNNNQVAIQPWQLIDPKIDITITEVLS